MPRYVSNDVENAGYKITIIDLFEGNLDQAHILYLTRIQRERFPWQEEADKYRGDFRLNHNICTQHYT